MSSNEPTLQSAVARLILSRWLNKSLKITMSDGRILIGVFLCVDRDCNIIVGNCSEYLNEADLELWADARILGLALVPGRHIVRICEDASRVDETFSTYISNYETAPLLTSHDADGNNDARTTGTGVETITISTSSSISKDEHNEHKSEDGSLLNKEVLSEKLDAIEGQPALQLK